MATTSELEAGTEKALKELEQIAGELRVQLHLAGMDMKVAWSEELEPLLYAARARAKETSEESLALVRRITEDFRHFTRAHAARPAPHPTLTVHDVMTKDVATCRPEDPTSLAARQMWDRACGTVAVVDEARHPVAVLTDRDICMAAYTQGRALDGITVASAMSRRLFTVYAHDKISIAESIMRRNGLRRLPVVDKEGVLVGVLSLDDILRRAPLAAPRLREPLAADTLANTAAAVAHVQPMAR